VEEDSNSLPKENIGNWARTRIIHIWIQYKYIFEPSPINKNNSQILQYISIFFIGE